MATEALPRYLVLTGPTAAGKTAAALAIAQSLAVEIISVDSALVYRGMDIGTAKPSAAERAGVPHHLIDIRDPTDPYSAAEFATDARRLVTQISARGKLPLLVGGTMLYLKVLFDGIDALPPANAEVRAGIAAEAKQKGWPTLHAELTAIDPASGARLHPGDSQRIARALEVYRLTGRALSSFHTRPAAVQQNNLEPIGIANEVGQSTSSALAHPHGGPRDARNDDQKSTDRLLLSLEPQSRAWLHQRIVERFDAMLEAGLMTEVQLLRSRGDLRADLPALRCVGYRQAWQALDENWPRQQLRERGIAATRQLAKRQLTWLRSMPARQIVACDLPGAAQQVCRLALAFARTSKTRRLTA